MTNPPAPRHIRAVSAADLPALKALIDATGLFPGEMLDGMLAEHLGGADDAEAFWLTDDDEGPVALAYCALERMTEGTWNLYLIAVHPTAQRQGRGAAMLRRVEAILAQRGARLLLIETSGLPEFDGTRAFYRRCGYVEEARIRDFYRSGEDKHVFRKALPAAA